MQGKPYECPALTKPKGKSSRLSVPGCSLRPADTLFSRSGLSRYSSTRGALVCLSRLPYVNILGRTKPLSVAEHKPDLDPLSNGDLLDYKQRNW